MVISRPCTRMSLLATFTKRFMRWKKSARSKKLPLKVNSSGTLSRPGAPGAVAPSAGVPEARSRDRRPRPRSRESEVFEASLACSVALPAPVEAFSPPAAASPPWPGPLGAAARGRPALRCDRPRARC